MLYYPVFAPDTGAIVGSVTMELLWSTFLSAVYPPQSDKVDLIVENSCGQNFTFNIDLVSESMSFIGEGDLHDRSYSNLVHSSTFEKYEQIVDFAATVSRNQSTLEYCRYKFHVFATEEFEDAFTSNDPLIYAIITGVIFIFTSLVFVSYDFIVDRRQKKVMGAATRTNDIVAELFPKEVRERLYERAQEQKSSEKKGFLAQPTKTQMQNFLSDDLPQDVFGSEPIADFFPQATIMFLDIAGFTAWSSEREPVQVFRLLETIYGAFDGVAKGLGVFKVETIVSLQAVCF
uniref:Guanylate cyclase domain-containing protein n=1 Tax=Entomoneis paludosa TaxID=265537 RepID=A0A7S3DMW7_9STRA